MSPWPFGRPSQRKLHISDEWTLCDFPLFDCQPLLGAWRFPPFRANQEDEVGGQGGDKLCSSDDGRCYIRLFLKIGYPWVSPNHLIYILYFGNQNNWSSNFKKPSYTIYFEDQSPVETMVVAYQSGPSIACDFNHWKQKQASTTETIDAHCQLSFFNTLWISHTARRFLISQALASAQQRSACCRLWQVLYRPISEGFGFKMLQKMGWKDSCQRLCTQVTCGWIMGTWQPVEFWLADRPKASHFVCSCNPADFFVKFLCCATLLKRRCRSKGWSKPGKHNVDQPSSRIITSFGSPRPIVLTTLIPERRLDGLSPLLSLLITGYMWLSCAV